MPLGLTPMERLGSVPLGRISLDGKVSCESTVSFPPPDAVNVSAAPNSWPNGGTGSCWVMCS